MYDLHVAISLKDSRYKEVTAEEVNQLYISCYY